MPHDPKHIIADIEDMLSGIVDSFATVLAGTIAAGDIVLAFKDERVDITTDPTFPRATLSLYDQRPADRRRYGGADRVVTREGDDTTTIVRKPVPIDLLLQLDTYALTHETDWAMMTKLLPLFDVQQQLMVTTTAGREFFLKFESWRSLDEIEPDNWFRKVWRFRAEVWFASPRAVSTGYVVLQRKLGMGGQVYTMDAAP